jgi:hypothetical protein
MIKNITLIGVSLLFAFSAAAEHTPKMDAPSEPAVRECSNQNNLRYSTDLNFTFGESQ